jgi:hypothetical protein
MRKSTAILTLILLAAVNTFAQAITPGTNSPPDTNSFADTNSPSTITAPAPAPEVEPTSDVVDLKSFNIIMENNIFDQSRVGLTRYSSRPRVPRVDRLTLSGITGDFGKPEIYFSGNSAPSDFVHVGDHIHGFAIKSATLDTVTLSNGSNTFVLQVPSSLRRVDDGPWEKSFEDVDAAPVASTSSDDNGTASSSSSTASPPSGADAPRPGESDILRKLRLRREQEEK